MRILGEVEMTAWASSCERVLEIGVVFVLEEEMEEAVRGMMRNLLSFIHI